ncbi:hypothetical protein DAPPUDRAFT_110331 [Daphnia pulex]|uniref:Uncharacterized protein n=1 Tax=Daphnia pulex TaxID=6669 RepID=E9H5Z6_DAPPU|nr:hypothetical protein DAPPUDRAFT_110331 [Daphnia pulex]|eukprot:EFX72845.1 hypothetical protein DAPPUDRAFT_110331 [Daphnia pulex]
MGHPRGCCRSGSQQGLHRENSFGTPVPSKSTLNLLRQRVVAMPGTATPTNVPAAIVPAAIVPAAIVPAAIIPPPLEPVIALRQSRQRQPRSYGPATRRSARTHSAPLRYPA